MRAMERKNGFVLYFIFILMIMFVGSTDKLLTFPAMFTSAVLVMTLINKYIRNNNVDICKGIMILLMFQNLAIGLGAHIFSNTDSTLKYITQIPFVSIFIIWLFIELNNLNKSQSDKTCKYFYLLLICIFFSVLVGRGNVLAILVNLRNMTVFYMIYSIGKKEIKTKEALNSFIIFCIKLAIIFLVFGIILLITGYDGYKMIGIKEVYIAKGVANISDRLDGRFYTTLISKQYMRMGSLLYEPVNLAYFYAAVSIATIFCDWTKHKGTKIIFSLICIFGLILTFGKGGYMIFGIALGAYFFRNFIKKLFSKINEKSIFKFTTIFIIFIVTIFCVYYYKNIGAAVKPHFWGIERTWASVMRKPYGYGLGTGGNASSTFRASAEDLLETGGETALMSFMYQIGIQGIIALLMTLASMTNFSRKEKKTSIDKLVIIYNYIPFILLGVSLLQDNTFTPQCIVIYMFILGALKTIYQND